MSFIALEAVHEDQREPLRLANEIADKIVFRCGQAQHFSRRVAELHKKGAYAKELGKHAGWALQAAFKANNLGRRLAVLAKAHPFLRTLEHDLRMQILEAHEAATLAQLVWVRRAKETPRGALVQYVLGSQELLDDDPEGRHLDAELKYGTAGYGGEAP